METHTSHVNGSSFHNAKHYENMNNQSEIEKYLDLFNQKQNKTTQQIIDEMDLPEFRGFKVLTGKVNDTITGGNGNPRLEIKKSKTPIKITIRKPYVDGYETRGIIPCKDQCIAFNDWFMRKNFGENFCQTFLNYNMNKIKIVTAEIALEKNSFTSFVGYQYHPDQKRFLYGFEQDPIKKNRIDDELVQIVLPQSLVSFGELSYFLKSKNIRLISTETEHGVFKKNVYYTGDLYTVDNTVFEKLNMHGNVYKIFKKSFDAVEEIAPGKNPFTDKEKILLGEYFYTAVSEMTGEKVPIHIKSWEDSVRNELSEICDLILD